MSRLGFRLLHWFWMLFSPTYRHEMALQDDAQHGRARLVGGQRIHSVHSPALCLGQTCAVHMPSLHHMSEWPQNWRADKALMERICPHGIGHPDPDDVAYAARNSHVDVSAYGIHGCDGCCQKG